MIRVTAYKVDFLWDKWVLFKLSVVYIILKHISLLEPQDQGTGSVITYEKPAHKE